MKRRNLILLSALLCCFIASSLPAESADADLESRPLFKPLSQNSSAPSLGWDIASILIALAVVIAAIYLLLRLLRRFFPNLAPGGTVAAPVKPLARFHLAPRQTLHLVRCGSRLLLLGATSASINHITTIDDEAEIDRILQALNRGQSPLTGLSRLFHRSPEPLSEKLEDQ